MSRTARFEVVRSGAAQPWHARFRAANGRIVWTTEQYARREAAWAAIRLIVADAGKAARRAVAEVDERTPPLPPPTIEPPYYVKTVQPILDIGTRRARRGPVEDFWHDREYHWRNCYGDECTEGVPPAGASVCGRLGPVPFDEQEAPDA